MGPALLNRYPVPIASMAEITHQEVRLRFLCAALKLWRGSPGCVFQKLKLGYRTTDAVLVWVSSHCPGGRASVPLRWTPANRRTESLQMRY